MADDVGGPQGLGIGSFVLSGDSTKRVVDSPPCVMSSAGHRDSSRRNPIPFRGGRSRVKLKHWLKKNRGVSRRART